MKKKIELEKGIKLPPIETIEIEKTTGAVYADKETLLREADFVSLHVPLLPATRHLIGASYFTS